MLRVGLIGAGRIGKVHARSIAANPGSRLVAVWDVAEAAAADLAGAYGAAKRTAEEARSTPFSLPVPPARMPT